MKHSSQFTIFSFFSFLKEEEEEEEGLEGIVSGIVMTTLLYLTLPLPDI